MVGLIAWGDGVEKSSAHRALHHPYPPAFCILPSFACIKGTKTADRRIDICDLKEKVGDCELLVNCEPKNPALEMDSLVPLTHHDPKVLGLICLLKKRKIHFRILSDSRIHPWIFLKKRTLIFESDVKGEALHASAAYSVCQLTQSVSVLPQGILCFL